VDVPDSPSIRENRKLLRWGVRLHCVAAKEKGGGEPAKDGGRKKVRYSG